MARCRTTRQPGGLLARALDDIDSLKSKYMEAVADNKRLQARLAYYENAHSPPSAKSLEWKEARRARRKARKAAPEGGDGAPARRPGGQPGHRGASRRHAPGRTARHGSDGGVPPECGRCGRGTVPGRPAARDIPDFEVVVTETRHAVQTAVCPKCGRGHVAPSGLPARGSYGKNTVAALRHAAVPFGKIAGAVREITGVRIAKPAAINVTGRTRDAMRGPFRDIVGRARRSKNAGADETRAILAGEDGWARVIQSGRDAVIVHGRSRGPRVPGRHAGGYRGIVTSDRPSAYGRSGPGGRHRPCRPRGLRELRHAAERKGTTPRAGVPRRQVSGAYAGALAAAAPGRHPARLRRASGSGMRRLLFGHGDAGGTALAPLVGRLQAPLPHLFTFPGHRGAGPTNNAPGRGLRHVVVSRKISGQTRGGKPWRDRWSYFMTCMITWERHGKSLSGEVSKIV